MGAGLSTEAEREPLLSPSHPEANIQPVNSRVYGRRWLVLTLFSLLALMQGMVWNFWGPIQNSAAHAFGFTKSDIAVLVLWGPVGFVPWLLFMWLMDKRGLRASLLLSAFFMLLGAALRSVPLTEQPLRRWLIHGGQFLNGLAGPTIMSAGPYLSTTWFAPDQRATATAVASLFSYLGGATSFIVGPLVVPAPNDTQATTTMAAAAVSDSSIRDRIQLVINLRFLMIALAYAVPTGVIAGWSGVLDMVLTPAKVSQVDAGWIGFWSTVGGCVFGVAMARFADSIRGMLKLILVLMLAGASLSSTWFTLTCLSRVTHLPSTAAILYTSCILVGIFINSSVPIFFELFIETVYPVPEGITCGVVTFLGNLVTGLLLFFLTFYCTELSWLNWCLTGSCLFSLVLILFFRESYDRLYLDVFVSV
ncbi:hypothetical protein INR49_010147 [Caranx melampygus]|nr:hypothetical protein INR49_010147 [Caranx melampygus]